MRNKCDCAVNVDSSVISHGVLHVTTPFIRQINCAPAIVMTTDVISTFKGLSNMRQ
jgi:hypothetical protein